MATVSECLTRSQAILKEMQVSLLELSDLQDAIDEIAATAVTHKFSHADIANGTALQMTQVRVATSTATRELCVTVEMLGMFATGT